MGLELALRADAPVKVSFWRVEVVLYYVHKGTNIKIARAIQDEP